MAAANLSADARPSAPKMARPGYGKREAPGQLHCSQADFSHLPEREAYLATFIDRLPKGAAMDYKMLAKAQPRYSRQAVRSALNALSKAGRLRRFQEDAGENRTLWVTRTFFSRTARDNDWWARFKKGEALQTAEPAAAPTAQPAERPAARPARSDAYEALADLGAADHRMILSAAECDALEPLAAEWLARGVTAPQLIHALTAGLPPEGVHSPAALARRRLTDKMPPEPKRPRPAAPRRIMICTDCERPGRPDQLPGGLCRDCRNETLVPATFLPGPAETDVHAQVARLRAAARTRPGSDT
jgi:hypothetical protein